MSLDKKIDALSAKHQHLLKKTLLFQRTMLIFSASVFIVEFILAIFYVTGLI